MPPGLNERFILAESAALKRKLEGLTVSYPRQRTVDVWFRWPNKEVREVSHPLITIDLVDITKSDRREHAGDRFELGYLPVGFTEDSVDEETHALVADEWPTPYDLTYAVTVISLDPRHDMELKYKLLGNRALLPHRMGYLEIPEDSTVRRLDVLDVATTSSNSGETVQHITVFTVRTESELFPAQVAAAIRAVTVNVTVTDTTGIHEAIPAP